VILGRGRRRRALAATLWFISPLNSTLHYKQLLSVFRFSAALVVLLSIILSYLVTFPLTVLINVHQGKYEASGSVENSRGVWRLSTILNNFHLHYTVDTHFKWEGWMVTEEHNQTFGYISNEAHVDCPDGLSQGWDFQLPSGWQDDTTLAVSCL